jgi:hypothetical protein
MEIEALKEPAGQNKEKPMPGVTPTKKHPDSPRCFNYHQCEFPCRKPEKITNSPHAESATQKANLLLLIPMPRAFIFSPGACLARKESL